MKWGSRWTKPVPSNVIVAACRSQRAAYIAEGQPLGFGHTLTDQICGQLDTGLVLTGFYEDVWPGIPLNDFTPTYIATRSVKLCR